MGHFLPGKVGHFLVGIFINFVRLLDKQEAIDLSERIPPLFYSKISKAVDEGKDIFHSFKSHHIRYCILQRIKRIREYNSQRF